MFRIDEIKNILVIRLGKIGDLIVTSFVFEAIKNFNKNINIDLLTYINNKPVIEANPNINNKYFAKKKFTFVFFCLEIE